MPLADSFARGKTARSAANMLLSTRNRSQKENKPAVLEGSTDLDDEDVHASEIEHAIADD